MYLTATEVCKFFGMPYTLMRPNARVVCKYFRIVTPWSPAMSGKATVGQPLAAAEFGLQSVVDQTAKGIPKSSSQQ